MGHHVFIDEIDASQYVEGVYTINNAQLGVTKSGKPFLKAIISDRTGRLTARMWNISEQQFSALPTDGFVWLEGNTQPYQGEIQLIIQSVETVDVTEADLVNLIPSSSRNISEMWNELLRILDTLEHPGIRALAITYLEDERLMSLFRIAPAAVNLHHAWLGGLLEHTLQLCNLADRMLPLYPALNRDLVIMSLFLHDLCKCRELRWDAAFAYTEEGQLLGHLVMGAMLLNDKARIARKRQLDVLRNPAAATANQRPGPGIGARPAAAANAGGGDGLVRNLVPATAAAASATAATVPAPGSPSGDGVHAPSAERPGPDRPSLFAAGFSAPAAGAAEFSRQHHDGAMRDGVHRRTSGGDSLPPPRSSVRLLEYGVQANSEHDILPARAVLVLQHILISHHGEPEFGAAKVPATPEAIFVANLDNLDAKTQMSIDLSRRDSRQDEFAGGGFSEKVWAIGTRLFRPDPLAVNEADESRAATVAVGSDGRSATRADDR